LSFLIDVKILNLGMISCPMGLDSGWKLVFAIVAVWGTRSWRDFHTVTSKVAELTITVYYYFREHVPALKFPNNWHSASTSGSCSLPPIKFFSALNRTDVFSDSVLFFYYSCNWDDQIKAHEMGEACRKDETDENYINILVAKPASRDHLRGIGIDERIILNIILNKWCMRICNGIMNLRAPFVCVCVCVGGGGYTHLRASQEGLWSVEFSSKRQETSLQRCLAVRWTKGSLFRSYGLGY
jgi:hypothetical protein